MWGRNKLSPRYGALCATVFTFAALSCFQCRPNGHAVLLTCLLRLYTYVHNIFYYSRYCLKHSNRSGWVVSPLPSDEGLNSPLLPSSYEASLHDVVVFLISSHTRHKYDPSAVVLLFCLILDSLQANYLRNRSSDEKKYITPPQGS